MISLRLSEVEYEVLKTQYRICGARTVSELARLALQRFVSEVATPPEGFGARLSELDQRVRTLESHLSRLTGAHSPEAGPTQNEQGNLSALADRPAL
jgi:hypothetical protein